VQLKERRLSPHMNSPWRVSRTGLDSGRRRKAANP
jgi:hypothetical protein